MACREFDTLPASWIVVLNALTQGPSAWSTPRDLADRLDQDEPGLTDVLADLDVAGWISVWEREDGLVVTLSSWAADQLRVRIEEMGGGLLYRWVDAGNPEPSVLRARGVMRSRALEVLDLVLDPQPTPEEALEALDFALWRLPDSPAPRDLDSARAPVPTLLIGEGLIPWPGPSPDAPRCPSCQGRALDSHEYCLRCDRWGLDDTFGLRGRPRPTVHRRPASSSRVRRDQSWKPDRPSNPASVPRCGEAQVLRSARKARRKCRLLAREMAQASRPR